MNIDSNDVFEKEIEDAVVLVSDSLMRKIVKFVFGCFLKKFKFN